MSALMIDNLSIKTKSGYTIIHDLNFQADPGDVVHIAGANGAGKSTLLRTCAGLLHPTTGRITFNDLNPHELKKKFVRNLGFYSSHLSVLPWTHKVESSFYKHRYLYGIHGSIIKERIHTLVDEFQCHDLLNMRPMHMSFGQRNFANLLTTFLHKPRFVILDEPNVGLDCYHIQILADFLCNYSRLNEAIVLMAIHDSEALTSICCNQLLMKK